MAALVIAGCGLACGDAGGPEPPAELPEKPSEEPPEDEQAKVSDDTVNIAFILSREARSAGAKQEVESIARELGMEPTRAGAATMTLKVSRRRFEELFGGRPQEVPAVPASARDAGAPAGHRYEEEIPVPAQLSGYVDSISVEPPARRLDEP